MAGEGFEFEVAVGGTALHRVFARLFVLGDEPASSADELGVARLRGRLGEDGSRHERKRDEELHTHGVSRKAAGASVRRKACSGQPLC